MKKTNKIKYAFIVDATDVNTVSGCLNAINSAKIKQGLTITCRDHVELMDLAVKNAVNNIVDVIALTNDCYDCVYKPKPKNIFKRFWNWITRKNK